MREAGSPRCKRERSVIDIAGIRTARAPKWFVLVEAIRERVEQTAQRSALVDAAVSKLDRLCAYPPGQWKSGPMNRQHQVLRLSAGEKA
jgi:hypothetical protein